MILRRFVPALGLLVLAGCGTAAVTYVHPGDHVLLVCQTSAVGGVISDQAAVDNANNTNPGPNGGSGQNMLPGQVGALQRDAAAYRVYAQHVPGHPRFAAALRNEAQEFAIAASAPDGLVTNTVAVATDMFSHQIQDYCGSYRVGAAAKASLLRPRTGARSGSGPGSTR